jgi:small subunit ribosomal protein S17
MRNIGIFVKAPQEECDDPICPFHSNLSIRGRILEGIVIKASMNKSVIVRRDYNKYVPKYMRYERRHSHIAAHNPPCINASIGDKVRIAECRPISKSISFVVVEKVKE